MADRSIVEPILEPDLPIVDPHHHVWFLPQAALAMREGLTEWAANNFARMVQRCGRYLFDELMADLKSGHNVRATVFIDAHAMYRAGGPASLKSVGEVEFVNGLAAMADSGLFGDIKACAGIVGGVDLSLGDAVEDVLQAHMRAGGMRYRGVRAQGIPYADDPIVAGIGVPHRLLDPTFRAGVCRLAPRGLSLDIWLFDPQIPELIDLARACPEVQIILNHVGMILGIGRYAATRAERLPEWHDNIRTLAQCPNVVVKLGGLGTSFCGLEVGSAEEPVTSEQIAAVWRPYIEPCIEAFGAERCMFESNFPVDGEACDYRTLWNAFKRIAAGASREEKSALFAGTAARIYRIAF
jgi:predicted TIM-barrel fold metal-dependent hydrolase